MDERLHKLKELVDRGIDEINSKPALDKETVCVAGELVDIRKDISTIEAMEEYGYSEGVYPMYYDNGSSYGSNYARGRGGRNYARGGGNSYGYNNGSSYGSYGRRGMYEGGYSRGMDGKDEMMMHLEKAMENASNEHEREKIHRMIAQMEQN